MQKPSQDTVENIEINEVDAADVPNRSHQLSQKLDLFLQQTREYDLYESDELIPLRALSPDAHSHGTADDPRKMSIWKTSFIIISVVLGPVGLLSFPYALAQGSFFALIANAIVCLIMAYSGKLIVRAFDAVSPIHRTYAKVGRVSMNTFGYSLATCAIILELFGAVCIKIIFIWNNFEFLIGSDLISIWIIRLICLFCLFPIIFMQNLSYLTCVSILEWISKVIIIVVIGMFFFLDPIIHITEQQKYPQSVSSFFIAIGIFVLSFGGHATFPVIKQNMKRPDRFERVLDVSFVIVFIIYSVVGLFGFLRYGSGTDIIITRNFIHEERMWELVVAKLLAALIVVSFYIQTPVVFHVLTEIPEAYCDFESLIKKYILRTVIFGCVVTVSWILTPYLNILEAVVGLAFTMLTSIICPILFYCALNKESTDTTLTYV